ncbi:MAG: replication-associated recombination protein A [Candidatus Levyibacteriota bacterium]
MNLAFKLRPIKLSEFFGQEHLVGKDRIIRKMIESDSLFSMILWGPPGAGKTTLANIIAKETKSDFYSVSAVETGKEMLLKIIKEAKEMQKKDKKTILFIDEIHRWNKAQQDALLPYVESGLITLIGATTENPSFEVISPLLSRCRVFVLKGLEPLELEKIIRRALNYKDVKKYKKNITNDAKELLIRLSGCDARIMLNALEMAVLEFKQKEIDNEIIKEIFQTRSAGLYDKKADEHYNIISAFIKSMRGSDPDATLYYLARMLENGEDPKFIARRMIILASEDIGLSDRGALIQANAGFEAVHKIGMPEAQLILAHIALYLAKAPKSRAVANALSKAKEAVYEFPNEPIPLHLRNAPTKLMKNLGYAKDYTWSEKYVGIARRSLGEGGAKKGLSFLPYKLKNRKFFEP